MRRFLRSLLSKAINLLGPEILPSPLESPEKVVEKISTENVPVKAKTKTPRKSSNLSILSRQEQAGRDLSDMMEIPFLALSKNRKNPISYESSNGCVKVKVTPHTGHFLASIYDWDIIIFIANRMQEIMNSGQDIPPRTIIIERHNLLKALRKNEGKKQFVDLIESLERLQLTGISTTVRNEDYQYRAGFGFLDSWGYTKRKDIKEIEITLSQWLYDGICSKGALLKVSGKYFELTSGLKRFLYRTARKHVGKNGNNWEFSVENLYKKSGSEREFRSFKSDLKTAVLENDLPEYNVRWIEKNRSVFVSFNKRKKFPLLEEPKSIL